MPSQASSVVQSRAYKSVFFTSTVVVAFCTIVVTVALSFMSYSSTNRNTDDGVKMRSGEVTTLIAKQSGGALKFGKTSVFEELFTDAFDGSGGAAVAGWVFKQDGELLSGYGNVAGSADGLDTLVMRSIESGELVRSADGFTAIVPIRFGKDNQIIGAIAMQWTSELLREQNFDEKLNSLFMAGLLGLGVLTCAALFLRMHVSLPLVRLRDTMAEVAVKNYETEVPGLQRKDEIGDLSRALDMMRVNLQSAEAQSTAHNLEQEKADKERAEMAAEREKATQREIELAKEKEAADARAAAEREEMMIHLGKSFGDVVEAAIDGEFSKRVDAQFSDRILNELADNINQLLSVVDKGLSDTGQVLGRVANGDLSKRMEGDFRGAFGRLQGNVNGMIGSLKSLIVDISGSGSTLASSSAEMRDTATNLSRQAEQNAASVEETSAALEQLTASIRQVSGNIDEASSNARSARDTAQSSEQVAADAAGSIERIAGASKEIARVVGVINDIAFQINLLALNAGVEAARAGDAGRGFSVVASEVRQLAQRASDAAKEIDTVIMKSDEAVSEGVSKVTKARSSLETIAQSVIRISIGIDEVSGALTEQVSGISEITSAVGQIDQNTQKQAASFEEVTAASSVLASEAESLQQSTARFRTGEPGKVVTMKQPPVKTPGKQADVKAVAGGGWDEF